MPTYEYECKKCGRVFEVKQRISEPPLTAHEACGGAVARLISPAPFILKGEGWYVTDYPSEARKKAKEAEKGATETKPSTDGKPSTEGKTSGGAVKTSSTPTTASSPASTSASPSE